jgi:starch synthase
VGILNGIDAAYWDPAIDKYISLTYGPADAEAGKLANKQALCDEFNLDVTKPLFIFIGRLVYEKAADLIPQAIYDAVYHLEGKMNFLILGSGEYHVESELSHMKHSLAGYYNAMIGYSEKLSHQMYAGADFLLMPSRVEPCGLNQMYAMRYGTVPVVRNTGGLRDTVIDFGDPGGYGIRFNDATVWDITYSIHRALEMYGDQTVFNEIKNTIMALDFSWETSTGQYIKLYESLK